MQKLAGLLLVVLSGLLAAPVAAYEPGDFAPRGSLLYARVQDLSGSLAGIGGEEWKTQAERMLQMRSLRDVEESEPLVEELRRFVDFMGTTEFIIGDVMVRQPHIQSATVVQLKEGAPARFSQEFLDWIKSNDRDAEIKQDSISFEGVRLWLKASLLVITTGGMMDVHVQDVIDGFTDESLSQVERFTKWSSRAKGDIVLFADMKAWRAAVDRLGEDVDVEIHRALAVVEWQKWDLITGSVGLPGPNGGGFSAEVSLTLNQPFETLGAFLKPSGGSRLAGLLPAECVGLLSLQLGRDHTRTWFDILRSIHHFELDARPHELRRRKASYERRLQWAREDLQRLEALKAAESDKDEDPAPDPAPQDVKKVEEEEEWKPPTLDEQIERARAEVIDLEVTIAGYEAEIEEFKYRPFAAAPEDRTGRRSDAERFHDEMLKALEELGLTLEESLGAVGQEALAGILDLPDPGFSEDDLDDAFGDMWFILAESTESWAGLKEKLLDAFLARQLPEDMPEDAREEARERAGALVFKEVDGGEILRMRGLDARFCFFGTEGFAGVAANEEVALRILESAQGQRRLDTGAIPGGSVTGSKFAWVDLRGLLMKLVRGSYNNSRERMRMPMPHFDLLEYLPAGFHMSLASDESSHSLRFSFRTSGEGNAANALRMLADEMHRDAAWRHDRDALNDLRNAVHRWRDENHEALKEMGDAEKARVLKGVTPQSLVEDGQYAPRDGLRSAFDPAMADRFKAMMKAHSRVMIGDEDDPADLSESGFEWFGLPRDFAGDEYGPLHILCAMKGDWAHKGRLVLTAQGSHLEISWLQADEYRLLRKAIVEGTEYQPAAARDVKQARWRVRRLLARKVWEMYDVGEKVMGLKRQAAQRGEDFRPKFKGTDEDDPGAALRKLLGVSEDDWFHFEDAGSLTIETDDLDGRISARYELDEHWIEIDEEGNITSSFDD
jgi:hypothetical protein